MDITLITLDDVQGISTENFPNVKRLYKDAKITKIVTTKREGDMWVDTEIDVRDFSVQSFKQLLMILKTSDVVWVSLEIKEVLNGCSFGRYPDYKINELL